MKMFFLVDIDRCWGCRSCLTACKREHGYAPDAPDAIDVARVEQVDEQGRVQCDFLPLPCLHCDDPACGTACPVHAIEKLTDGRVDLSRERCIGCGRCERACAYGAIALERIPGERPRALKCDLCAERRSRGLPPACVQHCMGRALYLVDEKEAARRTAGRYAFARGQTVYVSDRLRDLGRALDGGEPEEARRTND